MMVECGVCKKLNKNGRHLTLSFHVRDVMHNITVGRLSVLSVTNRYENFIQNETQALNELR